MFSVPKSPCVKGLIPRVAELRDSENFGRWGFMIIPYIIGGGAFEGGCGTLAPSSFSLPC
jgi:hypothetical protein